MGDLRAIVGRSPGVAVASVLRLSGSITFFGERTKDSLARYDARRASVVDLDHLARIRQNPAGFAPGGVRHLILEVLAHAADEAERNKGGRGACRVRRVCAPSRRGPGRPSHPLGAFGLAAQAVDLLLAERALSVILPAGQLSHIA